MFEFIQIIINICLFLLCIYRINILDKYYLNVYENKVLKHNIDECYKYIEQLEEEKRRNHYD